MSRAPRGAHEGRAHSKELTALSLRGEDGRVTLRSPAVGIVRGSPAKGTVVMPGDAIGTLEVLGAHIALRAPIDARGVVCRERSAAAEPVGYGDLLFDLDPLETGLDPSTGEADSAGQGAGSSDALVFLTPSSGRFYSRPSPDAPAFVSPGDPVSSGQTIGLLEIMKTFNRINYGGKGLPERAIVERVVPADGTDLERGDVILRLRKEDAS